MRTIRLAIAVALLCASCSKQTNGPVPTLQSVTPDTICTAQADNTLTIVGSGFSPAVIDGLTDEPAVRMPQVFLVAPSGAATEVPPSGVSVPDNSGTMLTVVVPTGLVGPLAAGDPEVVYDLRVVNPNGNEGVLSDAVTVVPPPNLTSVQPASGAQDTVVSVTLTGTGFRAGMTVTLDANPAVVGANVQVTSATSAGADFDLNGVAAGTYSVTVTNADGCSHTLPNAFTVFVPRRFNLVGIDPPFGCTCEKTTVTIKSDGGFVSTPRVEMRPAGQNSPVVAFERVAFIDPFTITAVVPPGAAVGDYDVTVINPPSDGGIGTLPNGFRVVALPIPRISAVVPGRGDPGADTDVSIFGENFRDSGGASAVRIELINSTGVVDATIDNVTPVSGTQIDTTFPTNGMSEGAYLVRVTNLDENTYSTFSNFLVAATGPSGNLHTFMSVSPLTTGRRMLAGASARDTLGNRFIYAIGGDTGSSGTVLDSVEVAQLSKFGDLGGWTEIPNKMNTPRHGAAAATVPVFDPGGSPFVPIKTYLFITGGQDDMGNVLASVERSVVLSTDDAPVVSISTSTTPGTLDPGTWYYKVSAVLGAGDPDNPDGETLPSDEAILTVSGNPGSITLSWDTVTVNGMAAAKYRVYRTDAVNGASQTEHFIAEVTGTSYTDSGDSAGTILPLPVGSTGVWVTQSNGLGQARWGHQAVTVPDTNGDRFIYVVGGKSNATAGYLGSVEFATVNDTTGAVSAYGSTNTNALATPRAFFQLAVETNENVAGFTGGARFFALGGVILGGGGGSATDSIEISDITTGGGNAAWAGYAGAGGIQNRAGPMAVITSEKLFVLGGAKTADNTTFSSLDMGGRDVGFLGNGDIGSPIQSSSQGLMGDRALGAVVIGAGFIYFVGGTSDGDNALATTETTF